MERSSIILGEEPASEEIESIELLKTRIVNQLIAAEVPFPIKSKEKLKAIYPKGTPWSCKFKGKKVSIHDLIDTLEDRDFPINTPGDAGILLTSRCAV
jgi:hypothetical protein